MRLTDIAHDLLTAQLQPGDHAIDATAGNGYDSVKMAELVGATGQMIAIDIQAAAIEATRARLANAHLMTQAELIQADHASALRSLCTTKTASISAITFNLGYLPGSDKSIQTTQPSTLTALQAASELLKPNGLLLVTAYRGHDGGQAEASSVVKWMHAIDNTGWSVENHEPIVNSSRIPPILWVARKCALTSITSDSAI